MVILMDFIEKKNKIIIDKDNKVEELKMNVDQLNKDIHDRDELIKDYE